MMRNRQFLFGIGSGLIIGALLLQLMNVAQTQPKMLNSEDDVRSAAETLGLRVYDSSDKVYTEEEWKEKTGESSSSAPAETPVPPSTPAEPSAPVAPTKADQPSTTPTVKPSTSTAEETSVKIKISSGSTLTEVATKLKDAGIISDKAAFIQQAKEWNASRTIQTGSYTFKKGESFKSITDKITTKVK